MDLMSIFAKIEGGGWISGRRDFSKQHDRLRGEREHNLILHGGILTRYVV